MNLVILYGTESGNAESVAEVLADELSAQHDVRTQDMMDYDPADMSADEFYLVICSTHGAGGLPYSAVPFHEALEQDKPDLSHVRYAMFGMGDSFYAETYSQGNEKIDRALSDLGAKRFGEYGRHDASSFELADEVALEWVPGILAVIAEEAN